MSLFVTATLASALAALAGGILLVRRADRGENAPGPEGSTPMGRLKSAIQAGDWATARPPLLAMGGLLGVMLFGALSLILTFDQVRAGLPMLLVAVGTIGWIAREYLRG